MFRVNGSQCSAFAGANVDIWHADIEGVYSDVAARVEEGASAYAFTSQMFFDEATNDEVMAMDGNKARGECRSGI